MEKSNNINNKGPGWGTATVFAVLLVTAFWVVFFLPRFVREHPSPPVAPPESRTDAASPSGVEVLPSSPADEALAEQRPPVEKTEAREVGNGESDARASRRSEVSAGTPSPPAAVVGGGVASPSEDAFTKAMSEGMAALGQEDYRAAHDAFQRAGEIRPGAPDAADGLAEAQQGLNLQVIADHREKALAFEARESWRKAAEQYQAVLDMEPTIRFAQKGRARSLARADLSERLEFHLNHPSRLSDDRVLAEASALLATASGIEPAGPDLVRQTSALEAIIARASTPVRIVLQSDNLTDVAVYRVGRLGKFDRRELELRPGTYTVVGSRRGYEDVRRQLVVRAGATPKPVVVRCEEAI